MSSLRFYILVIILHPCITATVQRKNSPTFQEHNCNGKSFLFLATLTASLPNSFFHTLRSLGVQWCYYWLLIIFNIITRIITTLSYSDAKRDYGSTWSIRDIKVSCRIILVTWSWFHYCVICSSILVFESMYFSFTWWYVCMYVNYHLLVYTLKWDCLVPNCHHNIFFFFFFLAHKRSLQNQFTSRTHQWLGHHVAVVVSI